MTRDESRDRLLPGRTAVVTGAGLGIGRGIAVAMAKAGANVVVADIDPVTAKATADMVEQCGAEALVFQGDVREYADNQKLVEAALDRFKTIDILVNNAGIYPPGGLLETTKEASTDIFNTNLIGPFFLTQMVAKVMVDAKTKGSILFTSSVHAQVTELRPAYAASKAGVEMFIKDVALELAEYGIRVNGVAPGWIEVRDESNLANQYVPMGRSGTPKDIGDAMVFLASDKASYITGQTLIVDGAFSKAHVHYWRQQGKM
ncbi:SDR family oxidoreductase [Candidatus Parcubacteria bacterium]|nr:SDR family oxidoreductase [Candidatus Parcubacteria bacterium]